MGLAGSASGAAIKCIFVDPTKYVPAMLPVLRKSLRSMLATIASSIKKVALSALPGDCLRHPAT
jgi:hypothetical protein